jgi:hypothetical protein
VLAFNDNQVEVQFLQSWERVGNFSNTDVSFLQDFAQRMQESAASGLLFPGDTLNQIPYDERLTKLAFGNINSIQLKC